MSELLRKVGLPIAVVGALSATACSDISPTPNSQATAIVENIVPNVGTVLGPDMQHPGFVSVSTCIESSPKDPALAASYTDTPYGLITKLSVEFHQSNSAVYLNGQAVGGVVRPPVSFSTEKDAIMLGFDSFTHTKSGELTPLSPNYLGASAIVCSMDIAGNTIVTMPGSNEKATVNQLAKGTIVTATPQDAILDGVTKGNHLYMASSTVIVATNPMVLALPQS